MEKRPNSAHVARFSRLPPASSEKKPGNWNGALRPAIAEDAKAIATVHIQSWQSAYRGQLPDRYLDNLGQELERRTEMWRSGITAPRTSGTEVWVADWGADSDRRIDGFVAFGPARDPDPNAGAEVYAIYVHPNVWGQGLGRTLLRRAMERLQSLGYSTSMLWVLESNARARRFYEAAGWSADGRTKLETLPDNIELRELMYRTRLNP